MCHDRFSLGIDCHEMSYRKRCDGCCVSPVETENDRGIGIVSFDLFGDCFTNTLSVGFSRFERWFFEETPSRDTTNQHGCKALEQPTFTEAHECYCDVHRTRKIFCGFDSEHRTVELVR